MSDESLVEAAAIDGSPRPIDGHQRRQGSPAVAEFAVVIVFNDDGVIRFRPFQQLQTMTDGHGDAERRLMCGRHINQFCVVMLSKNVHLETIEMHRHMCNGGTRHRKYFICKRIAGVFDANLIPFLHETPADEVDGVANAACYENIVWTAIDIPEFAKVVGDLPAQGRQAGRVGFSAHLRAICRDGPRHVARPILQREKIGIGQARDERSSNTHICFHLLARVGYLAFVWDVRNTRFALRLHRARHEIAVRNRSTDETSRPSSAG